MHNKKLYHHSLVIKILLPAVFFLSAINMPQSAYSQSCDRDGICETGETTDNCVYDCLVSTYKKNVKLHRPYGTERIMHYRLDGSKEEIVNIDQVKDFLLEKLDFAVYGIVGDYRLFNLTDKIPVLISRNSMHCTDLTAFPYEIAYREFMEYNQHEEWFVHDCATITQQTRVINKSYDAWLYNPLAEWIERFTEWTKWNLDNNTALDGVYYDETTGWLNWQNFYIVYFEEELEVAETVTPDNSTYKYVTASSPIFVSPKYDTVVKSIDLTQVYSYIGIWGSIIYLDNASIPAGTKVLASYYKDATVPQEVEDGWKQSRMQILEKTRQKIGGKLMVYNGFSTSRDYDNDFLQYADGGLTEGFVHTAGQLPAQNFTEATWLSQINHLHDISDSKKKIFLAQTSTWLDNTTTDDEINKLAMFSFASFLLGKGDYAYFAFHAIPTYSHHFIYFDYWGTDTGDPLENYHARETASGATIYEREFQNILVLVNPGEASAQVDLGASFQTLNGGDSISSVTLDSKSGIILYKTTQQQTTTTTTPTTTTTTIDGRRKCPCKKLLGENNPRLEDLRALRDGRLTPNAIGRKIIQIYYNNADSINEALERSPALRAFTRRVLEIIAPMVGKNK